jgi:hypothetical protein
MVAFLPFSCIFSCGFCEVFYHGKSSSLLSRHSRLYFEDKVLQRVYELCCCRFLHHQIKICLRLYKTVFIPCNKCRFTCLMVIPRICWSYISKKMSTHSTIALISLIFATLSVFSDCHVGHVMLIDYESRLPYEFYIR